MAIDILNAKKFEANGLLSKIEIGGKAYEIKDLIARENAEALAVLIDALSAKVGNVAEGQNLADIKDVLDKLNTVDEKKFVKAAVDNAVKKTKKK